MHPAMRNYQDYLYSCYGTVMVIVVWKINCAVVFNILTLGDNHGSGPLKQLSSITTSEFSDVLDASPLSCFSERLINEMQFRLKYSNVLYSFAM